LTGAGSDGNGIYTGGGTVPTGEITASGTRNVSNVAQTDMLFKNYKKFLIEAQLNSTNSEKASLSLTNLTTGTPTATLSTVNTLLTLTDSDGGYASSTLSNVSTDQHLRLTEGLSFGTMYLGDDDDNLYFGLYQQGGADDDYIVINNGDAGFTVRLDSNVMRYMADYSSSFVDRTLVDKAYVDAQVAANSGAGGLSYDLLTSNFLKVYIVSLGLGNNSYTLTENTAGDYEIVVPSGAEIVKMSIYGNSTTLQSGTGEFQFMINNNNNSVVYYPQVGLIDMVDGAILDLYTSPDFAPDIDITDRKTTLTLSNVGGLANEFVVTIR
jgi:hypothetical protein